ncbi:uncharacterized protein LOC131929458 isoform X2 [Physella acuta]|uniref:uncharacterized protein LOC131929458 isoform X2 n=1 Tax=Physella acuta TaxID=109671 RepID=UPI0027DCF0D4|nr:uncharacterized protein LOC131929458 isoform X2 [Physella acuta]
MSPTAASHGSMCRIILIRLLLFLGIFLNVFMDSVGLSEVGGFTVSRFPGLNLFALQCNGSHLPSDVRNVQHISLERRSVKTSGDPHIIASLSSVDGVRLEKGHGNANVYVSGKFDVDNIQSTSLTVLLADVSLETDVTYGCKISYIKRGGSLEVTERLLNVTFSDLQSLYKVQPVETKTSHHLQRAAQSTFNETKEGWGTPMILLLTMAILLFILLIICILLIIDRYRDHCKSKKRVDRLARKKNGGKEKAPEMEPRPLPSPPSWTYPEAVGSPTPRSPYNRLRFGGVGRNLKGYDSDASMNYCKPFDDIGEIAQEKPPFQTFGKQSSPIYATTPTILTA